MPATHTGVPGLEFWLCSKFQLPANVLVEYWMSQILHVCLSSGNSVQSELQARGCSGHLESESGGKSHEGVHVCVFMCVYSVFCLKEKEQKAFIVRY